MTPSASELLQRVSANLRAARQAQGLTQDALATAAGVSRRMLIAIEAGESNVSLATLDRIAAALGLAFSDLVREPVSPPGGLERPLLAWQGEHPESQAVFVGSVAASRNVELWTWALAPGERYAAEPDRSGAHTLLYVVEGTLTLEVEGGPHRIAAGQSMAFRSDQPYAYVNDGDETLRFVMNAVG